ncbi:MAG: hypothetical protein ACE5GZ_08780 [Gammaproteobacteria bacterium]
MAISNTGLEQLIRSSPAPQAAAMRLERLCADRKTQQGLSALDTPLLKDLVSIIAISNFLFHFICRHPYAISLIGQISSPEESQVEAITDINALRIYKYEELLKITWMDVSGTCDYAEVLAALSRLAVTIVRHALRLSLNATSYDIVSNSMCVMGLGKLGANELNYSSDIDLIFISADPDNGDEHFPATHRLLSDSIRGLSRILEEKTEEGFLYRVDLKLRPWGRSGPLVMSIDDTEIYYESSSESWERFAWLRARVIAGSKALGSELLQRMRPFIFMRSLSTDDLGRFLEIKKAMSEARQRQAHWNVKVGDGGIRDIEFFVQILQIVNAARHKSLQTTNTLEAMAGLLSTGLITAEEEREIYRSYLFLRRLENHLQMFDEQQTHDLPDEKNQRLILARSLGAAGHSNDAVLDNFEKELSAHRSTARMYFDRVLPGENL